MPFCPPARDPKRQGHPKPKRFRERGAPYSLYLLAIDNGNSCFLRWGVHSSSTSSTLALRFLFSTLFAAACAPVVAEPLGLLFEVSGAVGGAGAAGFLASAGCGGFLDSGEEAMELVLPADLMVLSLVLPLVAASVPPSLRSFLAWRLAFFSAFFAAWDSLVCSAICERLLPHHIRTGPRTSCGDEYVPPSSPSQA